MTYARCRSKNPWRHAKAQDGTKHEEVTFVAVTLWDRLGEIALKYLEKGSPVFIEGRLQLDTWEQQGQKRSRLRVIGQNVQLLNRRSELSTPAAAQAPERSTPATPAPSTPIARGVILEPEKPF
jgi:single-strand DNA-binding protein